jgi:alkyl hydroperoxide reductase subunit AhpC
MKLGGWLLLSAALAATGCAGAQSKRDASSLVGQQAPDWGRMDWVEGSPKFRLKDLKGKVVILHWWTDGCPDCVTNVALMEKLAQKYSSLPVQVIGMYFPVPEGGGTENMKEVMGILGIRFPVAFDTKWKVLKRYWLDYSTDKAVMTPTVVIDGFGRVRAILAGSRIGEEDARKLDKLISQLVAQG